MRCSEVTTSSLLEKQKVFCNQLFEQTEESGSAWHLQIHVIQQVSLRVSAFVKIWDCGKRPALEFILNFSTFTKEPYV